MVVDERYNVRGLPEIMSTSEGSHGKADVVRRFSELDSINQFQMWTMREGSKNPKILRTSLMEAPLAEGLVACLVQWEADRDDVDAELDRLGEADERYVVGDVPRILQEPLVHDDFFHIHLL